MTTWVIAVMSTPDSRYPEHVVGPYEDHPQAEQASIRLEREAPDHNFGYDPFFLPLPIQSEQEFWSQVE